MIIENSIKLWKLQFRKRNKEIEVWIKKHANYKKAYLEYNREIVSINLDEHMFTHIWAKLKTVQITHDFVFLDWLNDDNYIFGANSMGQEEFRNFINHINIVHRKSA